MASPITSSTFLLSLSLVLPFIRLSSASLSVKVTNDVLSDVCSKTQNVTLCLQTLKADPRTLRADLKGLGQISVDLALSKAKDTKNYVGSLIMKTEIPPPLKQKYLLCSVNYDNSISDLEAAKQAFSSGDYKGVDMKASGAMWETNECRENFKEPPFDPSQLPKWNQDFDFICSIILIISNLL